MDLANKPKQTETATSQVEQSSPQPKKSKLRYLWRSLFAVLLFLCAVFAYLSTAIGQKQLLTAMSNWLDAFSIERVEGRLQDGLTLHEMRYQTDGVNVIVGQADLHVDFSCMWRQQVCVEMVALHDTAIHIDTDKLPPPTPKVEKSQRSFNLPLPLAFNQLELTNIDVKVDENEVFLHHFHTGILGEQNRLQFLPTKLHGLTLSLAPQAVENGETSANTTQEQSSRKVDWDALEAQLTRPLLNKENYLYLPFELTISDFQSSDIQLERKAIQDNLAVSLIHIHRLDLQGQAQAQRITLDKLLFQSDKGSITGQGYLNLEQSSPLDLQFIAEIPPLATLNMPKNQVKVHLFGELLGDTQLTLQTEGAVAAQLQGKAQLSEAKTPFELHLHSESAQYPFSEKAEILKLSGLSLDLRGDLLAYHLKGSTQLNGKDIPSAAVKLVGKGGINTFDLTSLNVQLLGGNAELSGTLDWKEGIEWQSQLEVERFSTASLLPDWAAELSGTLQSKGYVVQGEGRKTWALDLNGIDLHGLLFNKKLQLKGDIFASSEQALGAKNVLLLYGENRFALNGVLGDRSEFFAEVDAPNLQGLIPHLQAGLKGNVKMKGKLSEPELNVDLVANKVSYQDLKLNRLMLKGVLSAEKQMKGDITAQLNQLHVNGVNVAEANLSLSGSEDNHRIILNSTAEPLGMDLQLSGKFDRLQQRWQGQLTKANLQTELGGIQNDKTIAIAYQHDARNTEISPHCWLHAQVQLCFPTRFQAGIEGKVPFEIKQLDLSMLHFYLDNNTELSGLVNAKGEAAWFKNRSPQINLALNTAPLSIKQRVNSVMLPFIFSDVQLNAEFKENNLRLKTAIQLENNGQISGDMTMSDLAQKRTLSGALSFEKLNIRLFNPLLSNGETLNGDINARLTLGGTLKMPLLNGHLTLSDLAMQSKMMPFDIVDGGLTLHFSGMRSTLSGRVKSKESELKLSGEADWRNLAAWHTHIHATAGNFRLSLPELGKIDVSPNISVKATPQSLDLNGTIDIPWARIEVLELPESATGLSSDEVIMEGHVKPKRAFALSNEKNSPKNGKGMAINADVSVNIGKDVRLEAYGLKTHLQGLLKVRQGNRGLGLYGQVNLHNGTFASFGQDLIIRKGLISFTGLPSQPTLDIEAIRNPAAMDNSAITAGVRASGLADNLNVNIFSDPAMAQDQALSYLLTGRGLDNNDGASSNSVAAALIGLGLSKGSKTVGSVGSAFGISDLNVSTEGIGDNTKVVVSGSLNSRLKVEYGVGLFAPLAELALRYRLAPNLYLQSISGINQAVDLLYRFEFD